MEEPKINPAGTHPHANFVKGYRKMTDAELALFNEGKELALLVGAYVEQVQASQDADLRWASIGKTDLQRGFMALFRAVARPEGF